MIFSAMVHPGNNYERARFWGNVDMSDDLDACWPWKLGRDKDGYGKFWTNGNKTVRSHRYAHAVSYGPTDLLVLHSCDNPICCNPKHLSAGTQLENRADCKAKGRTAAGDRSASRTRPERRPRGAAHPKATMTEETARNVRRLGFEGMRPAAIAKLLGVSKNAASCIVRGLSWRHL